MSNPCGLLENANRGKAPEDHLSPEQIEQLFDRTFAVGKAFGTVVVHLSGHDVQVTTFRTEASYSDRRRPDHQRHPDRLRSGQPR